MVRRIGLGILAVILIGAIVFGGIWGYNHFNPTHAEENNSYVDSTPNVSVTPMPTAVVTATTMPVVEPTEVVTTPVVVVPTVIPEEIATPVDETVEVTATPAVPVEVTVTQVPEVDQTDIPEDEVVELYANSNGYLFAFKEKNVSKITKNVNVDKVPTTIWLKNGRVYKPVAAWMKNDFPVEVNIVKVNVKNEELYTTAFEVVANTVMTNELGKAHRIFDETKKGELVVIITLSIGEKTKVLEVWYQEDVYALKVYYEAEGPAVTPPPPTTQPTATPRIPTDEPTATPRIPMEEEPTATPRIPMEEPTATPRVPSDNEIDWGFEGDEPVSDDEINWGFEGEAIVSKEKFDVVIESNDDEDETASDSESEIDWGFE